MGERCRTKRRRLKGWDYSRAGVYFLTFCTHNRKPLFGEIVSGEMLLSKAGKTCEMVFAACSEVDEFVVMPNHVHVLITLHEEDIVSISTIVRILKSKVTMACRKIGIHGQIWQPSFHDHIVRNQQDLDRSREYIQNNPKQWELDCMYQTIHP